MKDPIPRCLEEAKLVDFELIESLFALIKECPNDQYRWGSICVNCLYDICLDAYIQENWNTVVTGFSEGNVNFKLVNNRGETKADLQDITVVKTLAFLDDFTHSNPIANVELQHSGENSFASYLRKNPDLRIVIQTVGTYDQYFPGQFIQYEGRTMELHEDYPITITLDIPRKIGGDENPLYVQLIEMLF